MTDRELMQQALEALEWNLPVIEDYGDHEQLNRQHRAIIALRERLAQREGLTPEERKRRCGELLVQAQYMDSKEYLRWMNDSTKRPWVGLTRDEVLDIEETTKHPLDFARSIEAKLREKNT